MNSILNVAPQWLKWWLMVIALFWLAVYKLSESHAQLPDFVYVNF